MTSSRKSVRWAVTSWGDAVDFNDEVMVYLKRVKHAAPDTGREHWHTFIQFKDSLRMSAVKKLLDDNTIHLLPMKKTDTTYLEDGHSALSEPEEFGEKKQQGQRSDIKAFYADVANGMSLKELSDKHFACWLRYGRSIGEYRLLHMEYKAKYTLEDFHTHPISHWYTHWHLWGPPDTGKTQYALAQFTNPLYVRHQDHLKHYDPSGHDGIVVDELSFAHWPTSTVINMLNKKDPAMIHVRYDVAYLPAGVKIVFCSNEEVIFWNKDTTFEAKESILAKITTIYIHDRLY